MGDSSHKSIASRCAPVATPSQNQHADQSRVWPLSQMGSGILGEESLTLSCIRDEQKNEGGFFRGQIIYPIVGDLQYDPQVAQRQRAFELRVGVTADRKTGLIYRMLPVPGSRPNSWLESAENVMLALVGTWGYVDSDADAGIYRFQRLNITQPAQASFPDIHDLVDQLLAEFVIDSLDHPVLQRLLGHVPITGPASSGLSTNTANVEEEEDDIY
jgi:hypothetical protein